MATKYCVPHIEHYVNELDLVPRWGVLYNVCQILDNKYCGKIFVCMGASGHLFNQHYMDAMFSLDNASTTGFLNQVVDVDDRFGIYGEQGLARQAKKAKKSGWEPAEEDNSISQGLGCIMGSRIGSVVVDDGCISSGAVLVNFAEPKSARDTGGKTVRQLSHLCKYIDGGEPTIEF